VGREPVQRIRGVAFDREALFFSWSGYTNGAVEFATDSGVALFDVPGGQPIAWSPAAEEILKRTAEARRQKAEAEAAAEAAAREQARAAERRSLESEQRVREAQARAAAARAEKEAAAARRKVVVAEQLAERRRGREERRAERRRAAAARNDERKAANAPKAAERAARQAQLAALPGFNRDARIAAVLGTLGVAVPIGFGMVASWFALRARATLTRNGVDRSTNLLRYAAVVSTVGAALAVMLLASVPVTLTAATDEPPAWAGGLYLALWLIVGVAAVVAWGRASRTRPGGPPG
jgi:hypothetical protein